jgi:hypothetical protein
MAIVERKGWSRRCKVEGVRRMQSQAILLELGVVAPCMRTVPICMKIVLFLMRIVGLQSMRHGLILGFVDPNACRSQCGMA